MTVTAIADHPILGDLPTAAPVSTHVWIVLFCRSRFNSPTVFGALLDDERGGHCRVCPAGGPHDQRQPPAGARPPVPPRSDESRDRRGAPVRLRPPSVSEAGEREQRTLLYQRVDADPSRGW